MDTHGLPLDHDISTYDMAYYQTLAQSQAQREPIANCILRAAKKYNIHPDYIFTLAMAEGGTTGKYRKNNDGTHDMGIMQINYERWAKDMPRIGYQVDWRKVLKNTCSNVEAGTIIFKHRSRNVSDTLTALANYHWYVNVDMNRPHHVYKARVKRIYTDLLRDKQAFIETGKLNTELRCKYAACN